VQLPHQAWLHSGFGYFQFVSFADIALLVSFAGPGLLLALSGVAALGALDVDHRVLGWVGGGLAIITSLRFQPSFERILLPGWVALGVLVGTALAAWALASLATHAGTHWSDHATRRAAQVVAGVAASVAVLQLPFVVSAYDGAQVVGGLVFAGLLIGAAARLGSPMTSPWPVVGLAGGALVVHLAFDQTAGANGFGCRAAAAAVVVTVLLPRVRAAYGIGSVPMPAALAEKPAAWLEPVARWRTEQGLIRGSLGDAGWLLRHHTADALKASLGAWLLGSAVSVGFAVASLVVTLGVLGAGAPVFDVTDPNATLGVAGAAMAAGALVAVLGSVVGHAIWQLATAVLVLPVFARHAPTGVRPFDPARRLPRAREALKPALLSALAVQLGSTLTCGLATPYLAARLGLTSHLAVARPQLSRRAVSETWELTRRRQWRLVGLVLAVGLVSVALVVVLLLAGMLLDLPFLALEGGDELARSSTSGLPIGTFAALFTLAAWAVAGSAASLVTTAAFVRLLHERESGTQPPVRANGVMR
jgi:hypothetical protein